MCKTGKFPPCMVSFERQEVRQGALGSCKTRVWTHLCKVHDTSKQAMKKKDD
jgi:hypothetical protein